MKTNYQILQEIKNRFSSSELNTVCFDLGWESENFPREKNGKALGMLQYAQRHAQTKEFYAMLARHNPSIQFTGEDLEFLEELSIEQPEPTAAADPKQAKKNELIRRLSRMEKSALFDAVIFLVENA